MVLREPVSVVICSRDQPGLLGRALASVLPQLGPDDELIVVDDGSEPTLTVPEPARIVRTQGLGPAGARSAGLEAATRPCLAWCDDDDEWLPGHLDGLTAALGSDIDLVYGDAEWRAPGQPASMPSSLDFEGYLLSEWNYIPISSVVHRTEAARAVGGFDLSLNACEDWDLWLRMAHAGLALRHRAGLVTRCHWRPEGHASDPGEAYWDSYRRVFRTGRPRDPRRVAPPYDPATWFQRCQLVCRSVLRPFEGYGVVGTNLLGALARRGVNISIVPEGNQPPPGTEELHQPVPGYDRLALYYDYRNRPSDLGFERVVFYTMWESTLVPEPLVEAARGTTMVLVPCQQNADAFRASKVGVPVEVLHHGIDPCAFPVLQRPARSTFTFGTFGHLSPRKGTDVLIRAFLDEFGRHEDARLVLKSSVEASAYGCDDPRISTVSATLSNGDLLGLLSGFDAMVLPSRGEGFGLCGLEAMATGLPLVATNWSGPVEYLDPADSFPLAYRLVDAGGTESNRVRYEGRWAEPDLDDLRAHLRWIYEHREEAAAMGAAASRRVHRDWTWDRAAADLHRLLDIAATGPRTA